MTAKIIVKSRSDLGRWRAGLHFTRQGVVIDSADLTLQQAEAIANDPELSCTQVEGESDDQDKLALSREKKATKSAKGKTDWAEATEKARTASGLDEAAWDALAAADRVAQIETHMPAQE